MKLRRLWRVALTLLLMMANPVGAQSTKPVRIIVAFAAGGPVDAMARTIAEPLSRALGRTVLVENRPGASSIIGMQACAKSPPDGYTLCYTVADSLTYNPLLFKNLPYDAEKDFTPVVYVARSNSMLLARGDAPFSS